jgi:hypothetical protein
MTDEGLFLSVAVRQSIYPMPWGKLNRITPEIDRRSC